MTRTHEAILGWLLRDAIRNEGPAFVFDGIKSHAYFAARDNGKEAARRASREAVEEARRLVGELPRVEA